jgi:hypothetical protein
MLDPLRSQVFLHSILQTIHDWKPGQVQLLRRCALPTAAGDFSHAADLDVAKRLLS